MKKQDDVPVAEQKSQQQSKVNRLFVPVEDFTPEQKQPRVKRVYKFNSFDTRQMEIIDGERVISSSFRGLIKSLLLTRLSDSNIDLINVTFEYEDDNNSNLFLRKKYTLQRQDENYFCSIDEFLLDIIKVNKLHKVYFGIYMTKLDSFENVVDCQVFEVPEIDRTFFPHERAFIIFAYFVDFLIKNI